MTVYSYAQLEQLWINNGGAPALAPVAAAIAEAESSGNSQATNPTDNKGTQTSWGLWQISNGTHDQPVPDILDPNVNAQQAVAKYKGAGNSWSPWGTYDTGAYRQYLSGSTTPDPNVPAGGAGTGTDTATLASATTGDTCAIKISQHIGIFFGHGPTVGGCLLSNSAARGLLGGLILVAGGAMAVIGLALLAAAVTGRGNQAATAVTRYMPGGAVLARVLDLRRARDHHRRAQVIGDCHHVEPVQLVDDRG